MKPRKRRYGLRVIALAVWIVGGLCAAGFAAGPPVAGAGGPAQGTWAYQQIFAIAVVAVMTAFAARGVRRLLSSGGAVGLASLLYRRRVVFVGVNPKTLGMHEKIKQRGDSIDVVGFIDDPSRRTTGLPYLGGFEEFDGVLRRSVVDAVMVSLPVRSHYDVISRVLQTCETHGITAHYLLDLFDADRSYQKICVDKDLATLALHTAPIDGIELTLKHLIDRLGALVLLILSSPIILLAGLAVRFQDGGPAFFSQERVGYNKRPFRVFKLRTMVVNAEAMLASLEHLNERDGAAFKLADDPRVSWVGRILRKYSIDELPQLLNVLRGEMSLVGPRPLSIRDFDRLPMDWQRRRFSMRPGLTCTWQVSGRHNTTFADWMRMDLDYIDNFELLGDLKILLRTIPTVVLGRGV